MRILAWCCLLAGGGVVAAAVRSLLEAAVMPGSLLGWLGLSLLSAGVVTLVVAGNGR